MKTLGIRIRTARQNKDWTLERLAGEADISKSFLSELENDKREPSVGTIRRLSDALDVSVEWLVRGRDVKPMKCPVCKGQGTI